MKTLVRQLVMESPEWCMVGKYLDRIYAMQEKATVHYCKQRWPKMVLALRSVEIAAKKAQKIMTARKEQHVIRYI